MAYFKISTDKKGKLKAKIQALGRDPETDKQKVCYKLVKNDNELTPAKFHKYVEKCAIEFEEELAKAYELKTDVKKLKVLTFDELATEWLESVKKNWSINYYLKGIRITKKFSDYLKANGLSNKPVNEITVRHVQMFLNSFEQKNGKQDNTVCLKKALPKSISFRALARDGVITRCSSYGLKKKGNYIVRETAQKICEIHNLDFDEYFKPNERNKGYSAETIKGYRRLLRTVFNEAVRYDWITKNPVCATKVGSGNSNSSLRPINEKEVYSIAEAQEFMKALDELPEDLIYKRVPIKFMLLTGVRAGELNGLRWSDIDFDKQVVHIRRNRLVAKGYGIYEKEPKTKTSARDIPLPTPLIDDLKEYREWFRAIDDDFDNNVDEYYFAVNICREPVYPHTVGGWLKKFQDDKGFKRVCCHGLRHTYCSLLLSQNVPLQTVSKYMGHSDSTITLQVYSHFIPDTQEKALNALNNLF